MPEKQPTKEEQDVWREELERRLDEEEKIEEEYSGSFTRASRQAKVKRAPQGQTVGGFAERFRANVGFARSKRKPEIKIVDKTKK